MPPARMTGEYRCGHDEAQQVNSSRSYDPSVVHRDAMAASPAYARMFVSRVYTRPGMGWAWTICAACADTTKEDAVAA
ncbi:MAG: hypothetical protein AUH30_01910 [Candidatus Rokubacteria bacterium 13_1_40CM_68_15]|nr:MAG: hypothetical protein AUH30_01910 [Candidatus Rokubacteria bacterium 13_1_40CM_68_15]